MVRIKETVVRFCRLRSGVKIKMKTKKEHRTGGRSDLTTLFELNLM